MSDPGQAGAAAPDVERLIARAEALQVVLTSAIDILWQHSPNRVYVQLTETTAKTLREHIGQAADALSAVHTHVARLEAALREVEKHCPCGARPESPQTHPHVIGCPVGDALAASSPEQT